MPWSESRITRDAILDKLAQDDKMVVRSLMVLFDRQTEDEQQTEETSHRNGMGFNGRDAGLLSSFAKQVQDWTATPPSQRRYRSPLSPRQMDIARQRLRKYVGQLIEVAISKAPPPPPPPCRWEDRTDIPNSAKMSAWYNHSFYKVPVDGPVNTGAIHRYLSGMFHHPGLSGSSVGGYCSCSSVTDNGDGTVTVEVLYHIGD